jgi:E3 ubiquitin-protein ligase DOA10
VKKVLLNKFVIYLYSASSYPMQAVKQNQKSFKTFFLSLPAFKVILIDTETLSFVCLCRNLIGSGIEGFFFGFNANEQNIFSTQ